MSPRNPASTFMTAPALQALFHALYPAYMVLKSARRLGSADDPVVRRFTGLLAAACLAATPKGTSLSFPPLPIITRLSCPRQN